MLDACSLPDAQRQKNPSTVAVLGSRYHEGSSNYRLRVIEFDEQGKPWSNGQGPSALAAIKQAHNRPLVILFIHGWHHNADPSDANLRSFDGLLARLAEHKFAGRQDIIGIYIGWRGESVRRDLDWTGIGLALRQTSFYSRKNETDRVAGDSLIKTLYEISLAARQAGGHSIFIGHSFGGRILERTITKALTNCYDRHERDCTVPRPDLALLMNPAAELSSALELKSELSRTTRHLPLIISLNSAGDYAVGEAWPLVARLRSPFRGSLDLPGGHSPQATNYAVSLLPQGGTQPDDAVEWNLRCATLRRIRAGKAWWRIESLSSEQQMATTTARSSHYWIMSVPKEVIANHGAIFDDSTIEFVAGLYRISQSTIDGS